MSVFCFLFFFYCFGLHILVCLETIGLHFTLLWGSKIQYIKHYFPHLKSGDGNWSFRSSSYSQWNHFECRGHWVEYSYDSECLYTTLKEDNCIVIAVSLFTLYKHPKCGFNHLFCLSATHNYIRECLKTPFIYCKTMTILLILDVHFTKTVYREGGCPIPQEKRQLRVQVHLN